MENEDRNIGILLCVLVIVFAVMIPLWHLFSFNKSITDAEKKGPITELNCFYEVKENGISSEDGVLIINSININPVGENKHQIIVFDKSPQQIIELNHKSLTFIVKTHNMDKHICINDYFYCLENEWVEFMKFIQKETRPVGAALPPVHGLSYDRYYF
ncbi:hypothetical protein KAJ61_05695 [Candidatus Parcubacteria bacterium]|nr:hypothetical protein [Candidatus Parcubacteria bacterium]